MRVASAVRSGSLSKARVGVVSGLLAGIALGAVCFLGIVVVLIYTGYEWSSESRTIVLVSLLMFWVPQAVLAVVGRLLALLGRGKTVLALDGIRALATLLGLLVLSGAPLIAALSVTSVVSVAAYVLAVLRATRRPHFHST
jgi:O-antigen/teichoic acid export membrane protein